MFCICVSIFYTTIKIVYLSIYNRYLNYCFTLSFSYWIPTTSLSSVEITYITACNFSRVRIRIAASSAAEQFHDCSAVYLNVSICSISTITAAIYSKDGRTSAASASYWNISITYRTRISSSEDWRKSTWLHDNMCCICYRWSIAAPKENEPDMCCTRVIIYPLIPIISGYSSRIICIDIFTDYQPVAVSIQSLRKFIISHRRCR